MPCSRTMASRERSRAKKLFSNFWDPAENMGAMENARCGVQLCSATGPLGYLPWTRIPRHSVIAVMARVGTVWV